MYNNIKKTLAYNYIYMFLLLSLVAFSTAHAACSTANTDKEMCVNGSVKTDGYTTSSYTSNVTLTTPNSSPISSLSSVLWKAQVNVTKFTTFVQPVFIMNCTIFYKDYSLCEYNKEQQGLPSSSSSTVTPVGTISIFSPDLPNQMQCTASVTNNVASCSSPPVIKPGTYHYFATFAPTPGYGPSSSANSNTVALVEEQNAGAGLLLPILSLIQD